MTLGRPFDLLHLSSLSCNREESYLGILWAVKEDSGGNNRFLEEIHGSDSGYMISSRIFDS